MSKKPLWCRRLSHILSKLCQKISQGRRDLVEIEHAWTFAKVALSAIQETGADYWKLTIPMPWREKTEESQNHRIPQIGMDPQRSSSPESNFIHWEGDEVLELVAQRGYGCPIPRGVWLDWVGPWATWSSSWPSGWQPCLQLRGWNLMILEVPSKPKPFCDSVILWFYHSM